MLREEKHWPGNWSDGSWAAIKVQAPGSPSLGHPSPYLGWDPVVLSLFTKSFLLFVPWWKTTPARPLPEESPETHLCPRRGPQVHRWGKQKSHIHSSHQNKDMWLRHIIHPSWAGQLAKRDLQLLFKLSIFVTLIFRMNLRPVLFLANAVFLAFFRRTEVPSEAGKWQDFCPQAHKLMVSGSQANHFLASGLYFSPSTHTACYLHM